MSTTPRQNADVTTGTELIRSVEVETGRLCRRFSFDQVREYVRCIEGRVHFTWLYAVTRHFCAWCRSQVPLRFTSQSRHAVACRIRRRVCRPIKNGVHTEAPERNL